ncbi:MAG TPA: ATP-binding cassette domain-containing protein [Nocardioidaceae bacterium]|nr:ATP-binding cassette domain-containing protein [Nocardioidaceae bacterium]
MIEFENVTKRFDDGAPAVDGLSLVAPDGEITVFVGPSGCGKTTSLRMINRTIPVTSGTISVDGQDIATTDAVQLRRKIGYVIQHAGLFPHRTVVDNIATVPHLLGWDKKKSRSVALELLERVGLEAGMAKRYPAQLSGGQQQRVGVARALAADPPMLLMDEPFSAVDPIVRAQLQDEFLRLQQELGKTIAFVTHDIDEAIKLGDKVAVMQAGGTLAQFASPAELLSRPANDFVAEFIGRDRGYRRLSFVAADGLVVSERSTVSTDASADDVRRAAGDAQHVLVLDSDRRPAGWLAVDGGTDASTAAMLDIGTTFTSSQSLRTALDGALASPTGEAVCVDDDGRFVGVIDHIQIAKYASTEGARQVPT